MFAVVCPIKLLSFLLYLHKVFYAEKDKDWKKKEYQLIYIKEKLSIWYSRSLNANPNLSPPK